MINKVTQQGVFGAVFNRNFMEGFLLIVWRMGIYIFSFLFVLDITSLKIFTW